MSVELPKNYIRRTIGVLICFIPIVLLVSSVIYSIIGIAQRPFGAIGFMIAALFVAVFNLYLSFIRPWWRYRKHGSLEAIQHASVAPLVGTLLVILGGIFGFGAIGSAMVGLLAVVLDIGGSPWFLVCTWRDSSVWDAPR